MNYKMRHGTLLKIISSSVTEAQGSFLFPEAYGISHMPLIFVLLFPTLLVDNPN